MNKSHDVKLEAGSITPKLEDHLSLLREERDIVFAEMRSSLEGYQLLQRQMDRQFRIIAVLARDSSPHALSFAINCLDGLKTLFTEWNTQRQ